MPSPQAYARIAGVAYLVIIIVSMAYAGLVESPLIVSGDGGATTANILDALGLFRLGLVLVLVVYASVLVASWALYQLLRPVNRPLCLLALVFRCAEAILGAATVFLGLGILHLATGGGPDGAFEPAQVHALVERLVEVRAAALDVVLVFVGFGATLYCYVLLRSRYVPRFLASWGVATYVSMLGIAVLGVLVPDHPEVLETVLYGAGTAFELVFGGWLVITGVHDGNVGTAGRAGATAA